MTDGQGWLGAFLQGGQRGAGCGGQRRDGQGQAFHRGQEGISGQVQRMTGHGGGQVGQGGGPGQGPGFGQGRQVCGQGAQRCPPGFSAAPSPS